MGTLKRIVLISVIFSALAAVGCIRKSATVPQTLAVKQPLSTEQLVERINSYQTIRTIAAQVRIGVTDRQSGWRYSDANGALRLQRPENIRLKITATIVNADVADMTSDGSQFRLAVFRPKDKAVFVHGSNRLKRVRADQIQDSTDPRLKEVGALANIRPQHITDAFIIPPIIADANSEYFREEDRETEPDDRPNKKGHFIIRTYYVLYVLQRGSSGMLHPRRKFWFDRTKNGTPLVRQQTFEDGDGVISDILYNDFFYPNTNPWPWPQSVDITRPLDGYEMLVQLASQDSIEINPELPPTTFVLENTEHLKELNLDESPGTVVTSANQGLTRPSRK